MRQWLIQLGKALSIIRQQGVLRGGFRIFRFFLSLFSPVGSGDILFISGGLGDSARYRARHVAEELRHRGFRCSVATQSKPGLNRCTQKFSVIVFHRVRCTPSLTRMIENIRREKKTILFDTDDLVFDPRYFRQTDFYSQLNVLERKQYESGVGAEILDDPYTKVCTTTTEFLADILRKKGKRVILVPNKLSVHDVHIADDMLRRHRSAIRDPRSANDIIIGYFSGTKSHDKDFAVAVPALVQILEKYEHVKIFLAGPLDVGEALKKYQNLIHHIPYADRDRHFANIAAVDINIAPLEIGNPFCESKSELKFFEAGIVGVPTVASATQTFCQAIREDVDGYVARNSDEWFEKLSYLIEDRGKRQLMGQEARKTALNRYTTQNARNDEYDAYLRSEIERQKDGS